MNIHNPLNQNATAERICSVQTGNLTELSPLCFLSAHQRWKIQVCNYLPFIFRASPASLLTLNVAALSAGRLETKLVYFSFLSI